MIDLHIHSNRSDGSESPASLVDRARRLGVQALALTDHDTISGTVEFMQACQQQRISCISGVELSAATPRGILHILGLGIDPAHSKLNRLLTDIRENRNNRNRAILAKLHQVGCNLNWEEVATLAGDEVVGRPHFARALVSRGYATSIDDAFTSYLARGARAYVERQRCAPSTIFETIRAAGGLPIIAHPFTLEKNRALLHSKIVELTAQGLAGIEAYYSTHSSGDTKFLLDLAQWHNLIVTGGSDYHGSAVKPEIELGRGKGSLAVPYSLLAPLLAKIGPAGYYHSGGERCA